MLKGKIMVRWNNCNKKGKTIVWYIFCVNKKKEINVCFLLNSVETLGSATRGRNPTRGTTLTHRIRNQFDFEISSKHLCHWLSYFLKTVFKDVCFSREWDQSQASECLPYSKLWVWAWRRVFHFCACVCTQVFWQNLLIIERMYQKRHSNIRHVCRNKIQFFFTTYFAFFMCSSEKNNY